MRSLTGFLLNHRRTVLLLFAVLLLLSAVLTLTVSVNYNLAEYLPADSMTKRAISEMEKEFGYGGIAEVMVEDVTVAQALSIKARIDALPGIRSVLWLDDIADLTQPIETLDSATVQSYYRDSAARFQLTFEEPDYSPSTGEAIESIRALDIEKLYIAGSAEESRNMRGLLNSEILTILLVVVPFCVLIIVAASTSWIEAPLYLLTLLVSIAINAGTNAFFTHVSFITHAMAAVLQLAISMDYSLFLFHRYIEERDAGKDAKEALLCAVTKSLGSILASALTTIAGFLALVLMEYSIGRDIGLVLAKGITISLVCCLVLLPVLIYCCRNAIDRTRHKLLVPSFRKLGRGALKLRWVLIPALIIVLVPAYMAQSHNTFLYGNSTASSQMSDISSERGRIEERFGVYNPVALMVPVGNPAREVELANTLSGIPEVSGVQALATLADPAIPREMLPDTVTSQFQSEHYSRIVVLLDSSGETPEISRTVGEITDAAEDAYPGEWLAVSTPTSQLDIKASVERDGLRVQLISVLAVAVIVMLSFRSVTIPVLLVALIQSAIWINMSIPYFTGTPLLYIGYLMISSLQLGATIDYAILMTNRYREMRELSPPHEAAVSALCAAGPSVLVSTLVLAGAGFAESLLSKVPSISEIGTLLGRGALLSGGLVLIVLPPLLAVLDKAVSWGTWNRKGEAK